MKEYITQDGYSREAPNQSYDRRGRSLALAFVSEKLHADIRTKERLLTVR